MGLALLVWVGDGLLRRFLILFGNGPNVGQKISASTPAFPKLDQSAQLLELTVILLFIISAFVQTLWVWW